MYGRPEVVYVPVTDIPPIQIAIAWNADRRSSLIGDFVDAVRTAGRAERTMSSGHR
jgi:hypothetical protein